MLALTEHFKKLYFKLMNSPAKSRCADQGTVFAKHFPVSYHIYFLVTTIYIIYTTIIFCYLNI